jgi:hypothetical protein
MVPAELKALVTGFFKIFFSEHEDIIHGVLVCLLCCGLGISASFLKELHTLCRLLIETLTEDGHLAQKLQLQIIILEVIVGIVGALNLADLHFPQLNIELVHAKYYGRLENQGRQRVQQAVQ